MVNLRRRMLFVAFAMLVPLLFTVLNIDKGIEITHIGVGQNSDIALNGRYGEFRDDTMKVGFDIAGHTNRIAADAPGYEHSTSDNRAAVDRVDKLTRNRQANSSNATIMKRGHAMVPSVVGESEHSQHTSLKQLDVRAFDDDTIIPSLVDNSSYMTNQESLSHEITNSSNAFKKQVDPRGNPGITLIRNVDLPSGQNNLKQNQDIHRKKENGGGHGYKRKNDTSREVFGVGKVDNNLHAEEHASRAELLDSGVNNDHTARQIDNLHEYNKERWGKQQKGRVYRLSETQPYSVNWWDLITEGEFKILVDEFANKDLRFGDEYPEWFSRTDIICMEKLSTNDVIDAFVKKDHPRLRLLVFNNTGSDRLLSFKRCTDQCGIQKSTRDWFEIVSFHLDRVIGLKRALPAVARIITAKPGSGLSMDTRFSDGLPRPVIWWDPDIKHGGEFMFDQNSLDLSWTDYQRELRYKCNSQTKTLRDYHCRTKIMNIEWSKLAMFDFILQIHDRLDRNCCGYDRDEGENCDWRHDGCDDINKQFLVHIMVHKYSVSRLVFIDNAGNHKRSRDHLNYRHLKGITEFPENSINILRSGKFREMMKRSLTIDRWFWIAVGGEDGVDTIIDILEERVKALLDYIDSNENIQIVSDY
ncbi:uncharacterized protein LOC100370575 [Saccoglossus kowalevskii]|uniref:Uncharacterized protein LOC100370575 n=1 Tax=Saccoglossus kowalevskii TaxID=10224 RepID=A0ABM0GWN4_SACKO|nr:PREDICTED: uncharacterized protein LOC100370575 [Saccoglossus kowalevskii]